MPARKAGKNGSTRSGAALGPAVAEAVEARRGAAEIDDDEKERRQRVDAETRADPGQAERQDERLAARANEERVDRNQEQERREDERAAVDQRAREGSRRDKRPRDRESQERRVAREAERFGAHRDRPSSREIGVLITAPPNLRESLVTFRLDDRSRNPPRVRPRSSAARGDRDA